MAPVYAARADFVIGPNGGGGCGSRGNGGNYEHAVRERPGLAAVHPPK